MKSPRGATVNMCKKPCLPRPGAPIGVTLFDRLLDRESIRGMTDMSRRCALRVTRVALLFVVVLCFAGIALPPQAGAALKFFQFFGRMCVTVYDLQENHRPALRDDYAATIAPQLNDAASLLLKGMVVAARPKCVRPNQPSFPKQLMVELSVKRLKSEYQGTSLSVAVIGGEAPNMRGPLSEKGLMPVVILRTGEIDDATIEEALVSFFNSTVLDLLRMETQR
jgi:hypothetical protein